MKESPGPPQNFSRIIWLSGIGTVARFRAFLIFLSRRLQGGWRAAPVPGGGVPSAVACPLGRSPILPFTYFPAPSPRPPSPPGKGVPKSLFRRGLRPRHPGTEPPTTLTDPSIQVPCGKLAFLRHGFPPPRQSPKTRFPTGNASAAPVQPPGMQGVKPLI